MANYKVTKEQYDETASRTAIMGVEGGGLRPKGVQASASGDWQKYVFDGGSSGKVYASDIGVWTTDINVEKKYYMTGRHIPVRGRVSDVDGAFGSNHDLEVEQEYKQIEVNSPPVRNSPIWGRPPTSITSVTANAGYSVNDLWFVVGRKASFQSISYADSPREGGTVVPDSNNKSPIVFDLPGRPRH